MLTDTPVLIPREDSPQITGCRAHMPLPSGPTTLLGATTSASPTQHPEAAIPRSRSPSLYPSPDRGTPRAGTGYNPPPLSSNPSLHRFSRSGPRDGGCSCSPHMISSMGICRASFLWSLFTSAGGTARREGLPRRSGVLRLNSLAGLNSFLGRARGWARWSSVRGSVRVAMGKDPDSWGL